VVTNASGCSSPASPAVNVTVTATAAAAVGTALNVYPNPTRDGLLTLEMSGYRVATQLTVLDAVGRVVTSELLPATNGIVKHGLDLSQMATGVYLLRLSNADGVETRRLVRE
ncbi:MAG: T9SS type A sorting domain-containing protein, partial [Janthinobacterium lividum]